MKTSTKPPHSGHFQAAGKHGHEVLFNNFASTEHRLLDVDEIAVLGKPHGRSISIMTIPGINESGNDILDRSGSVALGGNVFRYRMEAMAANIN
jgi:hypothetical protein